MAKNKFVNSVHLEGLLYDHKLELRETGPKSKHPGTKYITGTVSIATDNKMLNIVDVNYSYVSQTYNNGKANPNWTPLMEILNGDRKTVVGAGADVASFIRIDSIIGLNEFFVKDGDNDRLVSAKRNDGGFLHFDGTGPNGQLNSSEARRSYFEADMIIVNTVEKEADPEKNLPAKVILKGFIFDFRKALLPVEFSAINEDAINYFLNAEISSKNPLCTKVWGSEISEIITRQIVTESAWGPDEVREVSSTRKDYVVTGASRVPYEWDDESFITGEEFKKAMNEREIHLATLKSDYQKRNSGGTTAAKAAPAKAAIPDMGQFNF